MARIEITNVSGLDVHRQERHSGCNALGRRNMFASLARAPCLFHLVRLAKQHRSGIVFAACCLLVMAISVHDTMLVVLNADIIGEVERNPVGRWLIELQGGEVWLFVLVKLVGTAIASAMLSASGLLIRIPCLSSLPVPPADR